MGPNIDPRRGMYFEEFETGQRFTTVGRTITESDIVMFAGLTGDYNLIHTNAEYSKTTPIGQRIAHGLLSLSIISGLAARTGILEGTVIVFREITDWKFIKPVFIGDTIYGVLEVIETKALRRLGGGAVTIEISVKNQNDETTMKGNWNVLIASKP
jgi:acyl dehydratase